MNSAAIEVASIVTRFGSNLVHDGVSFAIERGGLVALIGASGTGKSVLLREMVGLMKPSAGSVCLFGIDVWRSDDTALNSLRRRFGMLFQDGALFSSLSVADNVAVPLREHTALPESLISALVESKLALAGLTRDVGPRMPSELSGGMRKRVALARALALEPEILFLDEPTSGLDPISGRAFDTLIKVLHESLDLTIFIVTHDPDILLSVTQRIIVLDKGKVLADGPLDEVRQVDHPWIQAYFSERSAMEDRSFGA